MHSHYIIHAILYLFQQVHRARALLKNVSAIFVSGSGSLLDDLQHITNESLVFVSEKCTRSRSPVRLCSIPALFRYSLRAALYSPLFMILLYALGYGLVRQRGAILWNCTFV